MKYNTGYSSRDTCNWLVIRCQIPHVTYEAQGVTILDECMAGFLISHELSVTAMDTLPLNNVYYYNADPSGRAV
jgi:hypothetical protein